MPDEPLNCPFCCKKMEANKCEDCGYEVGKVLEHTFITIDDDGTIEVVKMTDQVLLDDQEEDVFDELSDDEKKDVIYVGGPEDVKALRTKLQNQPVLQ